MAISPIPPYEKFCECFDYDPNTGLFLWKTRPTSHFLDLNVARGWNAKMAGTKAFRTPDKDGYYRCEVKLEGRRYRIRANRAAFYISTGQWPPMVDHRNTIKTDDRLVNLRAATPAGNSRNCLGRHGRELPKGAYRSGRKFVSKCYEGKRKVHLGTFDTAEAAHAAYCAFAKERFGEFFNPGLTAQPH